MPTWHELREHARTQYTLEKIEDEWFSVIWAQETGRSQRIVVSRYEAYGQEWVEFRSFVCAEAEMSPRVALRKNADLNMGALALDSDGDYLLVHRAAIATLDQQEFALPLQIVATIADQLEREFTAKDDY
ncbi:MULTISPECIES: hypothetical protein [Actinoplanes]|uniref:YbjN domain-containing protein n=2 Tax=Actinoplanes TaxID=1865 RepID=A0A101JFA6_9ACTN|nr:MULTISPECIES: hypothetical protein [Actinoplanes]KUL25506.1 hypothetical protein ADL15_40590 [Actinoplanes awajinensis subsp. mycoplanecinus]GIE70224.1 hypothetical protein Apa02nite_063320 [Actinoplanes palleronii]